MFRFLVAVVLSLLLLPCLCVVCAAPVVLQWPRGFTIDDGKTHLIDNVTQFASGADATVTGSKTALVFDICGMSNVATRNAESMISIDIGLNASFASHAQLWFMCGPSLPRVAEVTVRVRIHNSTFTNTAFGLVNISHDALSLQFDIADCNFNRFADSAGLLSERPFAVLTGSSLIDLPVDTASSSSFLYDAVIFLHNVSIGGSESRLVIASCSIDARWQVPGGWSAVVYLTAVLHTGGMVVTGKGRMTIANCNFHVEGPQLVHGILHHSAHLTITDGAQYLMSGMNWTISGISGVSGTGSHVYGIYHYFSSSTISDESQYQMNCSHWSILGNSELFGIYRSSSSSLTITNGSQCMMRRAMWTVRSEGGYNYIHGIVHTISSSLSITNGSQYLMSETNWTISGGGVAVYGILYTSSSPLTIADGSQYLMSEANWTIVGRSDVYGNFHWSSSFLTISNGS